MGRLQLDCLGGQDKVYNCGGCSTYLTNSENLISKNFRSGTGEAFLFKQVVNVHLYELSDKDLATGRHWVRDISCKLCSRKLGWMYEMAIPEPQRYKESYTVLECALINEINGLKRDRNFEPFSVTCQSSSSTDTPTAEPTDAPSSSFGFRRPSYPSLLNYSAFHPGNIPSINDLAVLINGLNSQLNAQAFVDATAAVASASIARRSGARISLMRTITGNPSNSNPTLNALNVSTSDSSAAVEDRAGSSARSRHFVPNTNASAQMTRRSLRNMMLPTVARDSSLSITNASQPTAHARNRQSTASQRQLPPAYSRESTSSSNSSATATTFSLLPDNFSEASTSASSSNSSNSNSSNTATTSSSTSTTSSIRRLSINMNPSYSVDDSDEDVYDLRSGRRISRTSGNR